MDEGVSQTSLEPPSCDLDPIALHLPFVPDSDFARVTQTGQVSDSVVLMTALPKTGMQTRVRPPAGRGQHDVEGRGSGALVQAAPKRSSVPVSGEPRPILRPPLFAAKPLRSEFGTQGYGPVRPSMQLSNRWTPCPTRRERQALAPHVPFPSPRVLVTPLARPVIRPKFMQTYPEHAPLPRPVHSSRAHHVRRPLRRVPFQTQASGMVPAIPQSQPSDVPTPAHTSWQQCAGAVEAVRPPLRVKCPGLPPKPPAGQLQQVVSQADKHRENWDKVFVMWDELREFLYSLSSVLQETATSSDPLKLERALLQKLADTTASRYLSILLSFCQCAQESEVDLSSCRAVSLLDLVYSMQSDPKLTIHSCYTLKALRWVSKTFLVELHAWSPLMQVLEAGRDGQRREALPLPPSFMLYLERRVLDVSLDASSRCLAFVFQMRSMCVGVPCPSQAKSWIRVWLHLLGDVWDAFPAFEPDVLFFSHDASSFSPLSYCQALRLFRTLLVDYAPQCDPFAYSLHSMKTSVLAALAQLDLDEPARKLQGHHRVSSVTLYGRDDVSGAVRAQVKFLNALRSGFVPVTPIGRGGQVPIPSDSLDLAPVVGACVPEHPRFSYVPGASGFFRRGRCVACACEGAAHCCWGVAGCLDSV